MNVFIAGLDSIRQHTGASALTVHHTGWTEAERGRGNSSNYCAIDTEIQTIKDNTRVTLKCTKQKEAEHFPDMTFEAVPILQSLVLKPMDQLGGKLDGNRLLCLRAVQRFSAGASNTEWRKEAGLEKKKSSFNEARKWLLDKVYVKHEPDRKYSTTEAGRLAVGPWSMTGTSLVHSAPVPLVHTPGVCKDPGMDQTHGLDLGTTREKAAI